MNCTYLVGLCPRQKVYILFFLIKGSLIQTVRFLQKLEEAGVDLHLGVVWSCEMKPAKIQLSDVMKAAELESVGLESVDYNQGVEPEQTDFQLELVAEKVEAVHF